MAAPTTPSEYPRGACIRERGRTQGGPGPHYPSWGCLAGALHLACKTSGSSLCSHLHIYTHSPSGRSAGPTLNSVGSLPCPESLHSCTFFLLARIRCVLRLQLPTLRPCPTHPGRVRLGPESQPQTQSPGSQGSEPPAGQAPWRAGDSSVMVCFCDLY